MKKVLILLLSIFCFNATGCSRLSSPPEPPFCRVVTAVSIRVDNTPEPDEWHYIDSAKMTKALDYLRQLDSWEPLSNDPATIEGVRYHITVRLSDGSEKHYEQIAYESFRGADGIWRAISPEYGVGLALLLAAIPSDAI